MQENAGMLESIEKLWGGMKGKIMVIVSSMETQGGTGEGEILVLRLIEPFLYLLYPKSDIFRSCANDLSNDYKDSNIVLVGGIRRNRVTKEVLETNTLKQKLRFCFKKDRNTLIDKETGREYTPKIEKSKFTDYGLIIKEQNPFNEARKLFILAGCRTIGTQTAGVILNSQNYTAQMANLFGDGPFEVFFEREYVDPPAPNPITRIIYPTGFGNINRLHSHLIGSYPVIRFSHIKKAENFFSGVVTLGGFLLIFAAILTKTFYYGGMGLLLIILSTVHINWLKKHRK